VVRPLWARPELRQLRTPAPVTGRTYLSRATLDLLARAQVVIDQHVFTVRGFCAGCREPAPCAPRQAASSVFARYQQLPRRRPGLAFHGRVSGEDMKIEHQVRHPEWLCGTDGMEWPCDGARKLLAEAYQSDPDALTRYLAYFMVQAATDLGVASPAVLYRRFLGWTLARGEVCRVCGKAGHTVVAGLPPSVFPCDRISMRGD
jgi:hypothetical protein